MLVWLKAIAVLGASLLLMGSKLVIHMPDGGTVISSSGLFACSAGATCVIDIDQDHFAETFTAVAQPGYAFSHWGSRPEAICADSTFAQCDELDADSFAGDYAGSTARGKGAVFSLSPVFTGSGDSRGLSSSVFSVNSRQSTRYYAVPGNSRGEIWSALTGAANPLPVDQKAGIKPLGHASFKYKYDYQSEYAGDSSSCRVRDASFSFEFETVLPRLAADDSLSSELLSRWAKLQAQVSEHEAGHHAIYRQLVARLPEALRNVGVAPCAELEHRTRQAVTRAVEDIRRASADYDEFHAEHSYAITSL